MSAEQRDVRDALVLFSCKDYDMLGYNNQYIGEAFVHFQDIPDTDTAVSSIPQKSLQLQRPPTLGKLRRETRRKSRYAVENVFRHRRSEGAGVPTRR